MTSGHCGKGVGRNGMMAEVACATILPKLVLKNHLLCLQLPHKLIQCYNLQTLSFDYLMSLLKGLLKGRLSSITKGDLDLGLKVSAIDKGDQPNWWSMISHKWDDGREVASGVIWVTWFVRGENEAS